MMFRFEAEYAYRQNHIKSISTLPAAPVAATGKAHQRLQSLMANVYYDIPVSDGKIVPYIGAGVGGARMELTSADLGFTTNSKN